MTNIQSKTSTYQAIKKDLKLLNLKREQSNAQDSQIKPATEWLSKLREALQES